MERDTDRDIKTRDGRVLRLTEAGDPTGAPVVYLMGIPTSRLVFPLHHQAATRAGVRLISYDRPGYGGSTAWRGRTVADAAADVAAVADAVGIDQFGMWAFSGGPPFTLGVAAGLPDRVTRIVSLASPAPPAPVGALRSQRGLRGRSSRDARRDGR